MLFHFAIKNIPLLVLKPVVHLGIIIQIPNKQPFTLSRIFYKSLKEHDFCQRIAFYQNVNKLNEKT